MKLKSNTNPFKNIKSDTFTYLKKQQKKLQPQIGSLHLVYFIPELFIVCDYSHSKAAILAHLLHLSSNGKRSDGFVYKSHRQLVTETGYAQRTIIRTLDWLKEQGVLETKVLKANGQPTTHFRFDKGNLFAFGKRKLQENALNSNSNSEE